VSGRPGAEGAPFEAEDVVFVACVGWEGEGTMRRDWVG